MCIWNCPIADRHCEYCSYFGGCERREAPLERRERIAYCIDTMSRIVGHDILSRRRFRGDVWARNMVAYRLHQTGYSLNEIGYALGLHHSTVLHGCEQVERMLDAPKFYQEEIRLWKKFREFA